MQKQNRSFSSILLSLPFFKFIHKLLPSATLLCAPSHTSSPPSNILTFTHIMPAKNVASMLRAMQLAPHVPQK